MNAAAVRVDEAAKALGISKSGAYAFIAQGKLPAIRIGPRTVRVPVEALQKWLRTNTQGIGSTDVSTTHDSALADTPGQPV